MRDISSPWQVRDVKTQEVLFKGRPFFDCEIVAKNKLRNDEFDEVTTDDRFVTPDNTPQQLFLIGSKPGAFRILVVEWQGE